MSDDIYCDRCSVRPAVCVDEQEVQLCMECALAGEKISVDPAIKAELKQLAIELVDIGQRLGVALTQIRKLLKRCQ